MTGDGGDVRIQASGKAVFYPERIDGFKRSCFIHTSVLPAGYPAINGVSGVVAACDVQKIKLVETARCVTCAGQCLSGRYLHVTVSLKMQFKYLSQTAGQCYYTVFTDESPQACCLMLPAVIRKKPVEELLRRGCLHAVCMTEDFYTLKKEERSLSSFVTLLAVAYSDE